MELGEMGYVYKSGERFNTSDPPCQCVWDDWK